MPGSPAIAATSTLTLHLGDAAAVSFDHPPPAIVEWLTEWYEPLLDHDARHASPLVATFEPCDVPDGSVMLAIDDVRTAGAPDGRFLVVDGAHRGAELPEDPSVTTVNCDPAFDRQLWGPFFTWLERLVDTQAAAREMVTLKGAAIGLPEGNVAIAAFQGSGKTSTVLALLESAVSYLSEDRLTVGRVGDRAVAMAFPSALRLSRGRIYSLPDDVARRALRTFDRRLLAIAPELPEGLRRRLATRWVAIDVVKGYPSVEVPRTMPLDAIVFVQPHLGPLTARAIDGDTAVALATELARFHHDRYVAPFHQMHASVFPGEGPWRAVPSTAHLLPGVLAGVPATLLRVPLGAPAADVARAVRDTLG